MTGAMGNSGMGAAMMQPPAGTGGYPSAGGIQGGQGSTPMNQKKEVFCSNCAKKYPVTSRFCPHCGDPYNPCPVCGSDNTQGAKRCVTCGVQLQTDSSAGEAMGGISVLDATVRFPSVQNFVPNAVIRYRVSLISLRTTLKNLRNFY